MELPSGTVTFLFTDIESSTARWEADQEEMRTVLARHDELLRVAIGTYGGQVFKHLGDGLCAAFASAPNALAAAFAAQKALAAMGWPGGQELHVRMGLHTGPATPTEGDYFGPTVNRAARVMQAGNSGQVVCSAATTALCPDASLRDAGAHLLAGVGAERLFVLFTGEDDGRALRSPVSAPTNLTGGPSSFVGRAGDVAELAALVGSHPLVSLVGPGGIGKTRLAVETAAEVAGSFGDGVWFCDLAAVSDGAQVAMVVANTIGARQQPGMDLVEAIVWFLHGRRCLVILDNCEHVIDSAARLTRRLVEVDGTVVLTTTRELLGVRGEQVWPVAPLDPEGAVELFMERANERYPRSDLDGAGTAAVMEICQRLDGIPLAIELAAARTGALSPQAIAARLGDRFRLLRGGRRGERHQTLRDAVQWSYELLSGTEAILFDRLAVFAGGFSIAAAEAVCADGTDVTEQDVLDVLANLVDKSMIQRDPASGERFVLLETLRQFAEEQLDTRGSAEDYRARQARYYRDLVVAEESRLASPDEGAAWAVLHEEWDNIRAAFEHALSVGDANTMADITAGLGWYGPMSFHQEAGAWARAAIESGLLEGHPAETAVRGTWAITDFHLAGGGAFNTLQQALGDPEAANPAADRWAAWLTAQCFISQGNGDRDGVDALTRRWADAEGLSTFSSVHAAGLRAFGTAVFGFDDNAAQLSAKAAEIARTVGSPTLQAMATHIQGMVAVLGGDHRNGLTYLQRSRDLTTPIPFDCFLHVAAEVWFAIAAALGEDLEAAAGICRDSLRRHVDRRLNAAVVGGLRTAALVLARAEEHELAATLLGTADASGHLGRFMQPVIDQARQLITEALHDRTEPLTQDGRNLDPITAANQALEALNAILARLG